MLVKSISYTLKLIVLMAVVVIATGCSANRKLTAKQKRVNQVINTSREFVGTPYRYGGTNNRGMDCSGLLCVAFKSADMPLPRSAKEQSKIGKAVSIQQLQPGDLVFFATRKRGRKVTHVGMVTEVRGKREVKFIHASSSRGVIEDNLYTNYYRRAFVKARRPVF